MFRSHPRIKVSTYIDLFRVEVWLAEGSVHSTQYLQHLLLHVNKEQARKLECHCKCGSQRTFLSCVDHQQVDAARQPH